MSNWTTVPEGPGLFEINGQGMIVRDEIIQVLGLNNRGEEMVTSVFYASDSDLEDMYEEEELEDMYEEEEEEEEEDVNGASQKSIGNLEKVRIEESTVCSICLEEISSSEEKEEEAVRMPKPCCHVYHQNCILKWLTNHDTCPLCRYRFPN